VTARALGSMVAVVRWCRHIYRARRSQRSTDPACRCDSTGCRPDCSCRSPVPATAYPRLARRRGCHGPLASPPWLSTRFAHGRTGGSADGGIDVITARWAVQVKHTAKRVGRPAVQQLVGAALSLGRSPALFSTSGFSAPACDYALDHDVALFELDLDGSAHGINRPALRVGKRSRRLLR